VNTWSSGYAGGGGSGGRIAVLCGAHSYASDSWNDWKLRLQGAGGLSGSTTTTAAAAATIYVDCGTRNRTLLVDNGDSLRAMTARPSFVTDQMGAFTLREVRTLRSGHLRWPTLVSGLNNSLVSITALTGDTTGMMSVANRVTVVMSALPDGILPGAAEADASATSAVRVAAGSQSSWTATFGRTYLVDETAFSFAQMGVTTEVGSTFITPDTVSVVATALDFSGAVGGIANVNIQNSGKLYYRSTATTLNGTGSGVLLQTATLRNSSLLFVDNALTLTVRNVTASASTVQLGTNAAVNASAVSLTGGTLTLGTSASVLARNQSFCSFSTWTFDEVATAGAGSLDLIGTAVTSGNATQIVGQLEVTLAGTMTWRPTGFLFMNAGNLTIGSGVTIDGTGMGFASGTGPGSRPCRSGVMGSGGAHAGCGSEATGVTATCPVFGVSGPYGSAFAPQMMGSGGSPGCSCGAGGAGGGALSFTSSYAEVNGTIIADGATLGSVYCTDWLPGAGSGGSILFSTTLLGPSTGLMRSSGGAGAVNTWSSGYAGGGGSGGRIAVLCGAHSYASDSWSDWKLRLQGTGGLTGSTTTTAAAAATIYVDCGTRNRTLLVDNGDPLRAMTARPSFVTDQMGSVTLREVRTLRSGHLRWPSLVSGLNNTVISITALTGDTTGMMSMANRTTVALAALPSTIMPAVAEIESTMVSGMLAVPGNPSIWTATYQRAWYVDQTAFSLAQMGVSTEAGSLLITPSTVALAGATFDCAGAIGGLANINIQNNAKMYIRASSNVLNTYGIPNLFESISIRNSSLLFVDALSSVTLRNLTVTVGSTLQLGNNAVVNASYISVTASSTMTLGTSASLFM